MKVGLRRYSIYTNVNHAIRETSSVSAVLLEDLKSPPATVVLVSEVIIETEEGFTPEGGTKLENLGTREFDQWPGIVGGSNLRVEHHSRGVC